VLQDLIETTKAAIAASGAMSSRTPLKDGNRFDGGSATSSFL
jgi:hypothetical protein